MEIVLVIFWITGVFLGLAWVWKNRCICDSSEFQVFRIPRADCPKHRGD